MKDIINSLNDILKYERLKDSESQTIKLIRNRLRKRIQGKICSVSCGKCGRDIYHNPSDEIEEEHQEKAGEFKFKVTDSFLICPLCKYKYRIGSKIESVK